MTQETLLDNSESEIQAPKFEEAVGEGKRWKDGETLLKSKIESDNYIKVLEQRLDDFRDLYQKQRDENMAQAKLQELIDQLEKKQQLSSEEPDAKDVKPAIKPDDIESIFDKRIREYEVSKRQSENLNTVKAKLTERFGDNYQTVVKDQIKELGITAEDLDTMAKRSPALVFRTLGLDQTREQVDVAPPRSSNTFKPKVEAKHKPLSYYHQLKQKDPRLYLDPKIALQMDRDAQALGEAFFDVD